MRANEIEWRYKGAFIWEKIWKKNVAKIKQLAGKKKQTAALQIDFDFNIEFSCSILEEWRTRRDWPGVFDSAERGFFEREVATDGLDFLILETLLPVDDFVADLASVLMLARFDMLLL